MAETIISAIIGDVVSRVISHLIGRYCRHQQQSTEEAKLQMIRQKLVRIHSAVEEARGKQIANDGTLRWLSELIDAEYQGNYLLDCIKHGLDDGGEDDDDGKVVSTLSQFNPAKRAWLSVCNILSRRHDAIIHDHEIDKVAERLQGVCDGLREFIMLLGTCQPVRRPLATNIFRHGQMFGRHVEKERIISFLLHDDDDTRLAVLPIVGDTGIGKTTLVQHACDDARVRSHFQVIMLLGFSYTSAATAAAAARMSETTLVLRPKHVIGDAGGVDINASDPLDLAKLDFGSKRFLLVFEDVDTRKKQVLEDLLPARTEGGSSSSSKSKIIVTTNNHLVATIGTVKPIMLKALPFPEYWFFFRAHAFSGRDLEQSPWLVAAGKAVAKKLDGSFFGAKIVGGLLMNNSHPGFWRAISSSCGVQGGDMSALGDGINYVMDLSQSLLPRNMRMCQVVVSKDHRFSQTELSRLHGVSAAQITSWEQGYGFARVLLCESLLPFYNLFYIADCTAELVNAYSECEEVPCVSVVQFNTTHRVSIPSVAS